MQGGENMVDLRIIREAAGMTQEQLAEKTGVIRQTISNIERGLSLPSIPTAKAIAEILEFDWVDFYRNTDSTAKEGEV